MIISRKQSDPKWGKTEMGASGVTVAQKGCVITALSDILNWYGADMTPDVLARTLAFTSTGGVYWASITRSTGAKFIWRFYKYDSSVKKEVDDALKHPTKCVLLEFPFAGASHWCWAYGKTFGTYKICDPLRGDFATSTRYGQPKGCAIFDKQ